MDIIVVQRSLASGPDKRQILYLKEVTIKRRRRGKRETTELTFEIMTKTDPRMLHFYIIGVYT